MSLLPVVAVNKPADLAKVSNGRLGPCHLKSVYFAGINHRSIHHVAARAWEALVLACLKETGLVLSASGSPYRDVQAQTDLFLKRYVKGYNPLICTLADQRVWNGVRYFKRRGVAAVATPSTSNHGWGLAVDAAWYKQKATPSIQGIQSDTKGWEWLRANALRFGWCWETQAEPWHIRYFSGDKIPQAVLDVEAALR